MGKPRASLVAMAALFCGAAAWAYICIRAFGVGLSSMIAYFSPLVLAAVVHAIRTALKAKEADNGKSC